MYDINNVSLFSRAHLSGEKNHRVSGTVCNGELTHLTENLLSVNNSNVELYREQISDGILARFNLWQWFFSTSHDQGNEENNSIEERTELHTILTEGENLRRLADLSHASEAEETLPHGWKGSILQRCLVGLGLMGAAGYAGHKFYNARTYPESMQNTMSPSNSLLANNTAGGSHSGNLSDSLVHQVNPIKRTRHSKRHLPIETPSTSQPLDRPDEVIIEPVKKCYEYVGMGRLVGKKEVPCAKVLKNRLTLNNNRSEQPPYPYVYTTEQSQRCKTQTQEKKCQKTHQSFHKKHPDRKLNNLILNVGKTPCFCPPPLGDNVNLIEPQFRKKIAPPSVRKMPTIKPPLNTSGVTSSSGTEKYALTSLTEKTVSPLQQLFIPSPEKRYIISPELGKERFQINTGSSEELNVNGEDVKIEKMYDFSCIDERNNLSWADIIRQVGKTLGSPVQSLAEESQIIHHHNSLRKGCPSEYESLHLQEITGKVDAILSQVMMLLPRANPIIVLQQIVGPALEIYADELDGKPIDQQKIYDINQQVLFLSRQEIQTLSPEEKIGLYPEFPAINIKKRFNVINGEVTVKVGDESLPLKKDANNFPCIDVNGVSRNIHFNNKNNIWEVNSEGGLRASSRISILKIDTYRSEMKYDIRKDLTITNNEEIVDNGSKKKFILINGVEIEVVDGIESGSYLPAKSLISGDIIKKGRGDFYFEAESSPLDLEVAQLLSLHVNEFIGGGDKTSIQSDLLSYDENNKRYIKHKNVYHPLEDGRDVYIQLIDGRLAIITKRKGRLCLSKLIEQNLPDLLPITDDIFITSDLKMKLEQDGVVLTDVDTKILNGLNYNHDAGKAYLGVDGKAYKAIYSEFSPWILIDNKRTGHPQIPVYLYDDVLIRGRDDFIDDIPASSSCRLKRSPTDSHACITIFSAEAEKLLSSLKHEIIHTALTPVEGLPEFYIDLHTKKTYMKFKDHFFLSEYNENKSKTQFKNGVVKIKQVIGWKVLKKMRTAGKLTYHHEGGIRFVKTIGEELARITVLNEQDSKKIAGKHQNIKVKLMETLKEIRTAEALNKIPSFREYRNTIVSQRDVQDAIGKVFFKGRKNWAKNELSMIGDDMDFRLKLSARRISLAKEHALKVLSSAKKELDSYTLNTRVYLRAVLGTTNDKLVADFARLLSLRLEKVKKALDVSKIVLCHSNVVYEKTAPESDPLRDADLPGDNWGEVHWKPNFDEVALKRNAMALTYAKGDDIYINVDREGGIDPTSTTEYLRQSYSIEPFLTLIHEASHKNNLAKDIMYISIENNDYIPILDAIDEMADSFLKMEFHNPELVSPLLSDYFRTAAPYKHLDQKELFKGKNLHAMFKYDPGFRASFMLNIPDFLAKLASDIHLNKFVRT